MKLSLSRKLISVMIFCVVFAVILCGIVAFIFSRNLLIDKTQNQLSSVSILKSVAIDNFLSRAKNHTTDLIDNNKREKMLSLLSLGKEEDKKTVRGYFSDIVVIGHGFIDVFLINKEGVVVASGNIKDEGKIRDKEGYFIEGLEKTSIQSIYFDSNLLRATVIISTPIKDNNAKTQGVLVSVLGIDEISSLMTERSGLGKTGETILLNSSHIVITKLLKEPDASKYKTISRPQINSCLDGNSFSGNFIDYHGDQVMGYYRWYPSLKSCLITKIDSSEVLESINFLIGYLILILLLIIFTTSIFSYLIAKKIINPIINLRDVAIKIKEGDFSVRADQSSNDEIAEVAISFNNMIIQIKGLYSELEQKVKDKTLQLEQKVNDQEKQGQAMLNILEDSKTLEKQLGFQAQDLMKFKLVIEYTSDHVIITDPNGQIIFANEAAEKLTGFNKEEMFGNTPRLWGRQMSREFYVKMWDTIKKQKQIFSGEVINKNKKGELYPVEAMITPILDRSGNVTFFVGIERDTSTAKKLADRVLKEKEIVEKQVQEETKLLLEEKVKFAASINSLRIGFVMFDKSGEVMFNNRALEKVLGLEVKPKNIEEMQNILGNLPIKEYYLNCLDAGQPINVKEVQFKDKYLHLYLAPIFSADNSFEIIGIVVLVEDVSEEKILNRSRDEFFSIASHELRTPLTAIRGNTSLIKQYYEDKLPDQDVKEMINDINESSIRLIQIVNDFLNMSRLEMGKMLFKKEPIKIVEMARGVIKECELGNVGKNLYIKLEEPTEAIPDALGDAVRAREALMNLVGNALKYTEKGGVTVKIKTDGKFVKVMVSDTGRGISIENQKLLFKKFQQASDSIHTRDALKGTGLGLYISKLMMEGFGGKVELESTIEGQGSVFSMSIPVI